MDKYIGQIIGIYKILDKTNRRTKYGHALYLCECTICGKKVEKRIMDIFVNSKKCTHNHHKWTNQRVSHIFNDMRRRCYNEKDVDYIRYGAKGITICDEWLTDPSLFEKWALLNGYSDNLTIDRKDSSQGYNPSNCRWISKEENSRYTSNINLITVQNETLTGRQWAAKLNIGKNYINKTLRKFGLEKTIQLIEAILKNPHLKDGVANNISLMAIYNIV